jgi:hypothetical protein
MGKLKSFYVKYKYALLAWLIMILLSLLGYYFGVDKHVVGGAVILVGLIGQAFATLVVWIGFTPIVGPIIAKVLALPFIWLINGIGYLASIVAIKRGHSKAVLNSRVVTVALLIGITIGYILGKLI